MPEPTQGSTATGQVTPVQPLDKNKTVGQATTGPSAAPSEYFPGFGQEVSRLTFELESANKKYNALVSKTGSFADNPLVATLMQVPSLATFVSRLFTGDKTTPSVSAELDAAMGQLTRTKWKLDMLNTLPLMMAAGIGDEIVDSTDKVMAHIPDEVKQYLGQDDLNWLNDTFNKLSQYIPSEESVAGRLITDPADMRKEFFDALMQNRKLELASVNRLTLAELMDAFKPVLPELPTGMTADEARDIARKVGMTPEEEAELNDVKVFTQEVLADMQEMAEWIRLVKAGVIDVKAPALTASQMLKMLVIQPMLATVEMIDKYSRAVVRPLAGMAIAGTYQVFFKPFGVRGTDAAELERMYQEYLSKGENAWSAMSRAYEDWHMPWGYKLLTETVFDPFSYVGFGIAERVLKPIPRLARLAGAFERGIIEATDAPFRAAVKLGQRVIPKTVTQAAGAVAHQAYIDIQAMARVLKGKGVWRDVNAVELRDMLNRSLAGYLADPGTENKLTKVGKYLVEHDFINESQVSSWLKDITATAKGDITLADLKIVNDQFELFFKGMAKDNEAAQHTLAALLGAAPVEQDIARMAGNFKALKANIIAHADDLMKPETTKGILDAISDHILTTQASKLRSGIWANAVKQGRMSGWFVKAVDGITHAGILNWIDRRITAPMAGQYLKFLNYGPFNFMENIMRSAFGSGELMYPKAALPTDEYARISEGLSSAIFEFREGWATSTATKGGGRLEAAVIDPKTGKPKTFSNGVIPFISKDVYINGRVVGVNVRVAGYNVPVGNLTSENMVFGKIGTQQRAWAVMAMYKQELRRLAPEATSAIDNILDKLDIDLNKIKGLNKESKQSIRRLLWQDATVGPDLIAQHDIPVLELARREALVKVDKELAKMTEVYSVVQDAIKDGVLNGHAFRDVHAFMDSIRATMRDFNLAGLEVEARQLQKLALESHMAFPRTKDELLYNLTQLTDIADGISERVSNALQTVQNRIRLMSVSEQQAYHDSTWKTIQKYIQDSKVQLDYMTGLYKKILNGEEWVTDWSRVVRTADPSLKMEPGQVAAKWAKAQEAIDKMPISVKASVRSFEVVPRNKLGPRADADYNFLTGKIRIASDVDASQVPRTISHEINHGIVEDRFTAGDTRFYQDLVDTIYGKGSREAKLAEELLQRGADSGEIYQAMQGMLKWKGNPEEIMSEAFAYRATGEVPNPIIDTEHINKALAFIDSHLPSKLPKFRMTKNQLSFSQEMLDVMETRYANFQLARQADETLIHELISKKPKRFSSNDEASAWWDSFRSQRDSQVYAPWRAGDVETFKHIAELRLRLNVEGKLQKTMKPPPQVVDFLTPHHVAYVYGTNGADLYKGLINAETMTVYPREKFIALTQALARRWGEPDAMGFTADAIGQVYDQLWRNLGLDPVQMGKEPMIGSMLQLNELETRLVQLRSTLGLSDNDFAIYQKYVTDVKDAVGELDIYKTPEGGAAWMDNREQAMMKARERYNLDFTNYDNQNALSDLAKMVFPFWTYETQRWPWIARTFLQKPGVPAALGRYMDYSDGGYTPIPGTDLEINPLRGTVFMGGMRRLMLRDYPEYYDAFPGMEIIDYIGRFGFYPGFNVMLPIVAVGYMGAGKPEFGELAPAWVKTGLDAVRQVAPNTAGAFIDKWIFPDRFRDYLTMQTLGKRGYDSDEIWLKKRAGTKLTPEEDKLWNEAAAEATGLKGILMEQTGIFRIKPQEYIQFQQDQMALIEEMTGIPKDVQQTIRDNYPVTGKRLSDYFHLDVLQQKVLAEMEGFDRWKGITAPLQPSGLQEEQARITEYYDEVDKIYQSIRYTGQNGKPGIEQLTLQWKAGTIGPKQWVDAVAGLKAEAAARADALHNTNYYKDVPVTLEEREARYKEMGIPAPTYSPDQELLYMYYDIKPELRYNWESGRDEYDFDYYYALTDAILETLQGEVKDRFLQRIQYDWTPMEQLYWNVSREYLRPYRALRIMALEQYTPEEQQAIRRFEVARGDERTAIQSMTTKGGDKLISSYSSTLSELRKRFRMLDPGTDAWSYFFGITDKLYSDEAKRRYNDLVKQYLK